MPASGHPQASSAAQLAPDHHYVVSSDSHAGADLLDYKPYLESKWHDEFDAWAAAYNNPWTSSTRGRRSRAWPSEK
jgi:hypothetical protein